MNRVKKEDVFNCLENDKGIIKIKEHDGKLISWEIGRIKVFPENVIVTCTDEIVDEITKAINQNGIAIDAADHCASIINKASYPCDFDFASFALIVKRIANGRTQKIFANESGLHPAHLSRILNADTTNKPTKTTINKIAQLANDIDKRELYRIAGYEMPTAYPYHNKRYDKKKLINNNQSNSNQRHLYVDMDGCIAKWNPEASIEETTMVGYFKHRIPDHHLLSVVKELAKRDDISLHILSSVYQDDHSEKEKEKWLDQFLPEVTSRIFVPYGENKFHYISTNPSKSFLLDDFSKNLHEFERHGGIGIKYLNGINGTKGTWNGFSLSRKMNTNHIKFLLYQICTKY